MKTIKKGQKFKCVKDYVMRGGEIAYKAGKNYKSEIDYCLTDEQGTKKHGMSLSTDFYEHFELIESKVKIEWLEEINPKTMKTEIEIPAGCKIAKTEVIDGKLIVTYERDLPDSVRDIKDRNWFIDHKGGVFESKGFSDINNFSTKERAEAILALGQLIELAAYVGCEDVKIEFQFGIGKAELARDFHKKYADLFEKAKKLL
jgi:hypothetical protein